MRKKFMAICLTMAMSIGLFAGCGGTTEAPLADSQPAAVVTDKVLQVGIVQLVEHQALDAANDGFVAGLADEGFLEGENIAFNQQNAQADQSNLANIAQQFVSNNVDLIYAIATPAAQTMANATDTIPIIGSAITDYEEAKLVESNEKPGTNVTGTSDMNPIADQIDLLMALAPEAKTIGTIYSSSEINSMLQIGIMKEYAAKKGLTVVEATVSTVNDIPQAAENLVTKVDAIYVPTDNVIASAIPTLVGITDREKMVVVGGESYQVVAGALATVGIDYYELGVQSGRMAAKILRGEGTPQTMPVEFAESYVVTINKEVAERLGIALPQEILDKAEFVDEG